jgi:DNA processing protein
VISDELPFQIALTQLQGVGPVRAKNLIAHCGQASAVFKEKKTALLKIQDIGPAAVEAIRDKKILASAFQAAQQLEENNIQPIFFTDNDYPHRLKHCDDSPVLLFYRGTGSLNAQRVVSIVGTRRATSYGKSFCKELMQHLTSFQPLVVSGLAFGVDISAHRFAMECGLPTVACLAHGLDKIYPPAHAATALEMQNNGGLLSEHLPGTLPDRDFFPMRNRIIAGIADCTVVIETDKKGGSMITAHLAHSYGREVFALPGRYTDRLSRGCHALIKQNIAAVLTHPSDLPEYLGWLAEKKPSNVFQTSLFQELKEPEASIVHRIHQSEKSSLDDLCEHTNLSLGQLSSVLLSLEFKGLIKSLPGKYYSL